MRVTDFKRMDKANYVIGLDFGTDSVRALLADARTGEEIRNAVKVYPRWEKRKYCEARENRFRQHPLDYLESLEACIKEILSGLPAEIIEHITGISAATTGSTPAAVDGYGTPLALVPGFEQDPDAMFILWKDHTARIEADQINQLAHAWETDYTSYSGGAYSAEWFWSKILHIVKTNHKVRQHVFSWIEHCDWIPAVLTDHTDPCTLRRSRCAAGHKAMWHEDFGGLPSVDFLSKLDPSLAGVRERLYRDTYTADQAAGMLSSYWVQRWGLPESVKVGVGAIDAHMGAIGAGIKPGILVKVMGTSTCDMLVIPGDRQQPVKGICGQVDGSILPGMAGLEAGQSAFGDLYAWFRDILTFPLKEILSETISVEEISRACARILPRLAEKAAQLPVHESDAIALDWINGRRTPDADLSLTAALTGLRLGTDAPQLYKALAEATAFGSKAIVERFREEQVPVKEVIALGGIAKKSPFVMQTLANVLDMPVKVTRSEHACALGAAMCAATVSGIYSTIEEAQQAMSSGYDQVYAPEEDKRLVYKSLYKKYCQLGSTLSTLGKPV